MKDIIQLLNMLFPSGIPVEFRVLLFSILAILVVSGVVKTLATTLRRVSELATKLSAASDLSPLFSSSDVRSKTKNFITMQFQNVAPSIDDEPGSDFDASAKNDINQLFLNKIFRKHETNCKYYLVLADAGMGKTSFLINLYIKYNQKKISPLYFPRRQIRLFPLGSPNVLELIQKVEKKESTILLLDALDEDIEALKDYKKRLGSILFAVQEYYCIVLTCRTQFFPSDKELPNLTGYFSYGDNNEYKFQKMYLSVFTKKNISRYIDKSFLPWEIGKKTRSNALVRKVPQLVMRPLLLSYIRELACIDTPVNLSVELFGHLTNLWLERESRKPGIIEYYSNRSGTDIRERLQDFSQDFAVSLYRDRLVTGGYFLPAGTRFNHGLLELLDNKEKIGKTKALLTRDSVGNYKFSHKSIMEYYLAKKCETSVDFYNQFDFTAMDLTKKFIIEIIACHLIKDKARFIPRQKTLTRMDGNTRYTTPEDASLEFTRKELHLLSNENSIIFLEVTESSWLHLLQVARFKQVVIQELSDCQHIRPLIRFMCRFLMKLTLILQIDKETVGQSREAIENFFWGTEIYSDSQLELLFEIVERVEKKYNLGNFSYGSEDRSLIRDIFSSLREMHVFYLKQIILPLQNKEIGERVQAFCRDRQVFNEPYGISANRIILLYQEFQRDYGAPYEVLFSSFRNFEWVQEIQRVESILETKSKLEVNHGHTIVYRTGLS